MIIQEEHNIDFFINQLPKKPYCSNNLDSGLSIRNKAKALEMLYLQANQPAIQTCLLFDLDQKNAFYQFEDVGLPVPHFITKTPSSGRCHYGYMLKAGVCKTQQARLKPLKYAAAVELGMAKKLNADLGFAGLITKNPLNKHWSPYWSGADLYDLDYLSDFVELDKTPKKIETHSYGLGRNVNLFDDLRTYAYRNVLNFKNNSTYNKYESDLLLKAQCLNQYCNAINPLDFKEIKATARSIARWTWKHFDNATFSVIQAQRAKKKAAKTNSRTKDKIDNVLNAMGVL